MIHGNTIRGNTIRGNTRDAIEANGSSVYGGCVENTIVTSNGTTALVDGDQGIGTTAIGVNLCRNNTTCP